MSYAIINYADTKWYTPIKVSSTVNELDIFLPNFRTRKSKVYAKKVIKILNKANINNIVINKELLKNRIFCSDLVDNKKYIITGRRMYKVLILRILKDITSQMKINLQNLKVVLLIDEYSLENIDLIRTVSKEVKSLTVVTTDKDRFEMLVNELFDRYGIVLKVFEKNRINFKYANILINADFPSYDMNRINIASNSLIICGFAKHYEIKKNFNGIIIRDIDIITNTNNALDIDDLSLCEAQIYSYLRKMRENDRVFEREGYKINAYFGENGKITSEEFQKLGKIILDK